MPIPRRVRDEFFLPTINKYFLFEEDNRAVIYQPYDLNEPHFFERLRLILIDFDSFFAQERSRRQPYNDFFKKQMKEVIAKARNCSNISNNSDFDSSSFDDILDEFVQKNKYLDHINLTQRFHLELPNNYRMTNLLGDELAIKVQNAVFEYYQDLLIKQKKKIIYKQFKEFKINQHYNNQRKNNQMINVVQGKKRFLNYHKKRQIRHFKCGI